MKCPFGKENCFLCNFRRVKLGPCHYYHTTYGKCRLGNHCKFSHKGEPKGSCPNFFCKQKECRIEKNIYNISKEKEA